MKKRHSETRQHILDIARTLMTHKGYTGVGLAEVVATAQVPKGSFYHYFKSKDEFGQALLEQYFADYLAVVDSLLAGATPAADRLLGYFHYWAQTQCSDLPTDKCLVVKLGAEVCDLSEGMRLVLDKGTQAVHVRLERCIAQGHADGSITSAIPNSTLAQSLYQIWLGASLMMKIGKRSSAFENSLAMAKRLLS
ncbi:TetR/AcrR family transcriptional regulator [Pseudomonas sp. B21-017]|uniref:TetR/AcrR family transcriptional regulator n=1 Tax=Pseudomonas sp. B21-017 TaxID=2895474 RepID=UPI002160C32E|nr:TetR/AcrR family transcriptional regulator [Pseudomonas sp. B21-017]UVM36332.1 TetR/AcrR family transcriptional regulator [Pseudomonas sp. B21-017]